MQGREPLPDVPPAPPPSSLTARSVMRANRKTDTAPELLIRSSLHRRGHRFLVNIAPDPSVKCRVDILFAKPRIAVFVDGCFWHGCEEHGVRPKTNRPYWDAKLARNIARDRRNDEDLSAAGWTVMRVWEHESPEEAADLISQLVRQRQAAQLDRPSTADPQG